MSAPRIEQQPDSCKMFYASFAAQQNSCSRTDIFICRMLAPRIGQKLGSCKMRSSLFFERWFFGNYEDCILGERCFLGAWGITPRGRGCGEDRRAEPRGKAFPPLREIEKGGVSSRGYFENSRSLFALRCSVCWIPIAKRFQKIR